MTTCRAYMIWVHDCECGEYIEYDGDGHPDKCESCGAKAEEGF